MLRAVLPLLVLVLLAAPFAAEAQQAGKVWRLGVLDPGLPPTEDDSQRSGLVLGLRDTGYAEHQNLEFERRYAAGKIDRLPALAAELVRLRVDVIYTGTTPAVQAARMATSIIPIVFVAVGDPVGSGLVASLSHPGGNVTGVSAQMADLGAKQLQVLKECVPSTRRCPLEPSQCGVSAGPRRRRNHCAVARHDDHSCCHGQAGRSPGRLFSDDAQS